MYSSESEALGAYSCFVVVQNINSDNGYNVSIVQSRDLTHHRGATLARLHACMMTQWRSGSSVSLIVALLISWSLMNAAGQLLCSGRGRKLTLSILPAPTEDRPDSGVRSNGHEERSVSKVSGMSSQPHCRTHHPLPCGSRIVTGSFCLLGGASTILVVYLRRQGGLIAIRRSQKKYHGACM